MKHLFLFLLFLLPVLLSAQDPLPANPRKLRLGYQTDGEGIVLYGSGVPSYTPTRYRSAFHYMDTTNNIYYQYNRIEAKWDTILAGAGAVADGVSVDNSTWSKIGGTDVQQALTKTDSVLNNITIDGSQIQNKFEATTTTLTVSADTLRDKQRYTIEAKNRNEGDLRILLPQPSAPGQVINIIDSTSTNGLTYIEVDTSGGQEAARLKIGNRIATRYYLNQESILVAVSDSLYEIIPPKDNQSYLVDRRSDLFLPRFRGEKLSNDYYKTSAIIPRKFDGSQYSVDSIFVIPVQDRAPYGENLVTTVTPFAFTSFSTINDKYGVDGKSIAQGGITSAGGGQFRMVIPTDSVQFIGQKLSYSFWMRKNEGSPDLSFDVSLRNNTQTDSYTLTGSDFTYFSGTITVNDATSVTNFIVAEWAGSAGDTVWMDQAQVERTSYPSDYKGRSTSVINDNQLYIVVQPVDGKILFDDVIFPPDYTKSQALQATLDYCAKRSDCSIVTHSAPFTLDGSIILNQTVSWHGPFAGGTGTAGLTADSQPGKVTVEIVDSTFTTDVIKIENDEATGTPYATGQEVKNIFFQLPTPTRVRSVINTDRSLGATIENIQIYGSLSDSTHMYGVTSIADEVGQRGLFLKLKNVNIQNAFSDAVYLLDTRKTTIEGCNLLNNWRAVRALAGQVEIADCQLERNKSSAVVLAGPNNLIRNSTFESNAESTDSAWIYIDKALSTNTPQQADIRLINLNLEPNIFSNPDAKILLKGTSSAILEQVTLNNDDGVDIDCTNENTIIIDLKGADELINNGFVCAENTQIVGGGKWGNYGNTIPSIRGKSALLENSRISNGYIDTTTFSDSYWKGMRMNLVSFSDSINSADTILIEDVRVVVIRDSITGPYTPTLIDVFHVDSVGGTATTINIGGPGLGESLIIGEDYTLTFWLKMVESFDDRDSFPTLRIQLGNEEKQVRRMTHTTWKRYEYQYTPAATSGFNIQLANLYEGQKFAITGFSLVPGRAPLPYVPTTGTSVRDSNIVINSEKTIQFSAINAFDGGELYILPTDPDTLDFSAAGGLFDQIQDMTIGTLDNFTSSGDTLYYTGSVTRPFTINFTATIEADTGSQELQMRITKNGSSLDKCTVSKDYSTSGVEVQITGTCRLDLSTNDAIALEVSPTQNTSQLLVRRANINLH